MTDFQEKIKPQVVDYVKQLLLKYSGIAQKRQFGKSDKDWKTLQEVGKTIKEMTAKHR